MRSVLIFSGLALLLSWLLPVHFMPWVTFYQDVLAFLALALALVALVGFPRSMRLPKSALLIALVAIFPAIQLLFGLVDHAGDAWLFSFYILALALSVGLGFSLQRTTADTLSFEFLVGFSWLFILGALVSVGLALAQWYGYSDLYWVFALPEGGRPFANLAQPNNLATLLGFGVGGVLYLYERAKLSSTGAGYVALILIFGLALVESRTTWAVALFVVLFWWWQSRKLAKEGQSLRLSLRALWRWVAVYVLLLLLLPYMAEWLGAPRHSLLAHATATHRLDLYQQMLYAIGQGPWYGYGVGQVFMAQGLVTAAMPLDLPVSYSHNVLLDLLLWFGPVLGGLIIVLVALWWGKLLFNARTVTASVLWVSLSFFIMHAMLEFPHAYAFLLLPAGVLLGALQADTFPEEKSWPMPRALLVGLVVAGLALLWQAWRDYDVVEEEYRITRIAHGAGFVPKEDDGASRIVLLTQLRAMFYFLHMPLNVPYSEAQIAELQHYVRYQPRTTYLAKEVYILAVNGRLDEAFERLDVLVKLRGKDGLEWAMGMYYEASAEEPRLAPLLAKFGLPLKPAESTEP